MNEDEESLLESLQVAGTEEPADGFELSETPLDTGMSAMADALLEAEVAPGADENPDAATAVEEMLSAAMLEEVTASVEAEPAGDPGLAPTFQVKVPAVPEP